MTRVGTASIQGTTVYIEDSAVKVLFLRWEGEVEVLADDGSLFRLTSGQCAEATPGAAAVLEQEGLLDKVLGDAVMAEIGVPRSRRDAEEASGSIPVR